MNWHFSLLSYLQAKLWPVLLLTFILLLPDTGLATEAEEVPPCHYCCAVVNGMQMIPVLEQKFQVFAGSDSDRAGKGRRATSSYLFHKVRFRLKSPFRHHTTMLNLAKMTS